jgi:type IV pilus assembly protein PilQ
MSRRRWIWTGCLIALLLPVAQAVPGGNETPRWSSPPADGSSAIPATLSRLVPPGTRISIDFQDASLSAILRSFSECGGVNIVASPEVKGRATVALRDVDWAKGLDMVLRANGLAAVEEGGVVRVNSAQELANEELNLRAAERRRDELLPVETRMIRLTYAKVSEMKQSLQKMLTTRGTLEIDERTNTLMVVDIAANLDRIEHMSRELDTNTPQVEITAKLVDMDTSIARDLGIEWQVSNIRMDGGDATGQAGVDAPLGSVAGTFKLSTLGSNSTLDATLQALANDNKARIISNPRITTLDNQEAKIIVGKKIPLVVTDEAGNAITQLVTIGIKMTVTPHINSDDLITLELHPEVSDLSAQATVQGGIIIVTAEASTRVVVRNGETAVIGGLIRQNDTEYVTGVPLLKSIPLIGQLFRSNSKNTEERELVIFVTPRIIRT